jgi:signal transduction histidine kinase
LAHEFNNLLTAILGNCDLLKHELGAAHPAYRQADEISRAGERAALLTRQLLAFGRTQALQAALLDLNEVVRDVEQLAAVMLDPDVTLEVIAEPALGCVRADRVQIEQIVFNLVINARDAMPAGGRIVLETANADVDEAFASRHPAVPAGRYVSLAVRDSGPGAETDTQPHLSEPFFTVRGRSGATSLDLAVIYAIVKQSGGHIWAYSELGVGTTIRVYLPRHDPPDSDPARMRNLADETTQ